MRSSAASMWTRSRSGWISMRSSAASTSTRSAQRLDLDALVGRLDVNEIAQRLDMAKITAGATQDVAVSGLDLVRRQLLPRGRDGRLRGRPHHSSRTQRRPDAPGRLAEDVVVAPALPAGEHELQRREVSGHYAGAVTRLLALAGDVFAAVGLQAVFGWIAYFFVGLARCRRLSDGARSVGVLAVGSAFVAYFWVPVALFGRTPAMAILGRRRAT